MLNIMFLNIEFQLPIVSRQGYSFLFVILVYFINIYTMLPEWFLPDCEMYYDMCCAWVFGIDGNARYGMNFGLPRRVYYASSLKLAGRISILHANFLLYRQDR
jgi:hypothetical protein